MADDGDDGVCIGSGECVRDTGKAILVELRGPRDSFGGSSVTEVWIPQSCVTDDSEVYGEGHVGTVVVKRWFADKLKKEKGIGP